MSYATIKVNAEDPEFIGRVESCIAQEQVARDDPVQPAMYLEELRWAVASATDVEAAYASALAGGNQHPGLDPAVITDGMILSHVQTSWPGK